MKNLEKLQIFNELFLYYEKLLTDKQIECFSLYYLQDFSLTEIADTLNVSRNAVHDTLTKVAKYLVEYEEKLKLYENSVKRLKLIDDFLQTKDIKNINELRKMEE